MKLKNKETGKTYNAEIMVTDPNTGLQGRITSCASLAQVQEKWEDVLEEPKAYWYIYANTVLHAEQNDGMEEHFKKTGNYFESKEKAERALKKLKAYKRLKDKGLKFELCPGIARGEIKYCLTEESDETEKDLRTCFGGDDEQD